MAANKPDAVRHAGQDTDQQLPNSPTDQASLPPTLSQPISRNRLGGKVMKQPLISIKVSVIAASLMVNCLLATVTMAAENTAAVPMVSISEDAIAVQVRGAIVDAVGTKAADITVSNRNGNISLGGWANSASDVRRATRAATQVSGVKRVYANRVRLWSTRSYDS
jgi:hypothetical protein